MRAGSEHALKDQDVAPTRTPLILIWAFFTFIWSLFFPPHRTFAARVSLLQPLWVLRIYLEDAAWAQDLLLFLVLHSVYTYFTGAWRFLTPADLKWIDLNDHVAQIYLEIFGLLGACGILAGGIVHRGHRLKPDREDEHTQQPRIEEQLLPPLLITSRTSHSRLFPKHHAFSYSYLFVGIPVGLRGNIGSALSVDSQHRSWFHVTSADYLKRGNSYVDLSEKLKRYLHTQGVTDRDYAFAYLVTAPKFLGYSFNPVSFWYLYDSDTALKYVILEVNNTFDERRMYLLKSDSAKQVSDTDSASLSDVESADSPKKLVFTETFEKDFHVSPFNSRKGSYSLRATDPLAAYEETGKVRIDNTIVLRSSKENAKIVARVFSEGSPIEASKISHLDLIRFIAAWWWVGLVTFPRIVWEAQRLFFRRKLHVWYRPEVVETSVGRAYTEDERRLESFFRSFLENVVNTSEKPVRLVYKAAHADEDEVELYSPNFTYEEDHRSKITLQVLTPAFYSRFVHYAHAKEAFDRECLAANENNRTLAIDNPTLLPVLLTAMHRSNPRKPRKQSYLERSRWSWLKRLRCPPPEAGYSSVTNYDPSYAVTDIRTLPESELDTFVRQQCDDASIYRRIVTELFLAERLALGVPLLVSAADWVVRAGLLLVMMYYSDCSKAIDILRPKELGPREYGMQDMQTFAVSLLLANTFHIWGLIKG